MKAIELVNICFGRRGSIIVNGVISAGKTLGTISLRNEFL